MNDILIFMIFIFVLSSLLLTRIRGQIAMKNRIKRQINYAINSGAIKIDLNGVSVKDFQEVYAHICDKDYPVK